MKKISSVTIAIPAFNEEANIGNILNSLLRQNARDFKMSRILVYSDGSTDSTRKIVLDMKKKYRIIRFIESSVRRGKMHTLNQFFSLNKSDILVILDGDIDLIGHNFLEKLVGVIIKDPKAKMVAAHQIPLKAKTFVGKALYASFYMWDCVRFSIPGFDHVQNFYGAATAYRASFVKKLKIPEGSNEERLYLYLMAKKTNGFRYVESAQIVWQPVTTFDDFLKHSRRTFGHDQPFLDKIFGFKTSTSYDVPRKYKLKGILKSFLHEPFYAPFGLVLNLFMGKFRPAGIVKQSPLWEIAQSSKKLK